MVNWLFFHVIMDVFHLISFHINRVMNGTRDRGPKAVIFLMAVVVVVVVVVA